MYRKGSRDGQAMFERLETAALFALYQTSVVLGILLLPVALLANRAGVPLPFHRVVDRVGAAYDARAEA